MYCVSQQRLQRPWSVSRATRHLASVPACMPACLPAGLIGHVQRSRVPWLATPPPALLEARKESSAPPAAKQFCQYLRFCGHSMHLSCMDSFVATLAFREHHPFQAPPTAAIAPIALMPCRSKGASSPAPPVCPSATSCCRWIQRGAYRHANGLLKCFQFQRQTRRRRLQASVRCAAAGAADG